MAGMGVDVQRPVLTEGEAELLTRQVRRRKLSLVFCILNVAVALALSLIYFLTERFTALRAVVILLILIGAKNHMRIYRLSGLLEKLGPVPEAAEAPSDLHEQTAD